MSSIRQFPIRQFHYQPSQGWHAQLSDDQLISEEPLQIVCKQIVKQGNSAQHNSAQLIMMRSPGDDIHLVTGWLFTAGIVQHPSQIISIHHSGSARLKGLPGNQVTVSLSASANFDPHALQRMESVNSACGVCGQHSIDKVLNQLAQRDKPVNQNPLPLFALLPMVESLASQQHLFQQTGGNHGVALFDQKLRITAVAEDVGRHNAFDKVIGANAEALFAKPESDSVPIVGAILSGRVGYEMIQKALMANLRYVLALGAPSSLAVELAQEADMALIGFIKPQRFNLYCGEHLVLF